MGAHILGLADDVGVDVEEVRSHLAAERSRNDGQYGLIFATNRSVQYYKGCPKQGEVKLAQSNVVNGLTTGFIDEDVWNSHSMTHAAMSIYSGFGSVADALAVANKVIDTYRTTMADQGDYRDTTTPYDANGHYDPTGIPRPSVNSHYARQTIWWALPLALSGQQYDAQIRPRSLHFAPHRDVMGDDFLGALTNRQNFEGVIQWPVLLPHVSALSDMRLDRDGRVCLKMHVLSGELDSRRQSLTVTLALPLDGKPVLQLSEGGAFLAKDASGELC